MTVPDTWLVRLAEAYADAEFDTRARYRDDDYFDGLKDGYVKGYMDAVERLTTGEWRPNE